MLNYPQLFSINLHEASQDRMGARDGFNLNLSLVASTSFSNPDFTECSDVASSGELMRFDTLLSIEDIENGWSVDPSSTLDDWCPGTGQKVLKFFFKKLKDRDRIQISTRKFQEGFYGNLQDLFTLHARKIEAVVLEPPSNLGENPTARAIIEGGGRVYAAENENFLKKDLSRFFNVTGANNCRICVSALDQPYLAKSFYHNPFMSRHLSKSFEVLKKQSTLYSPFEDGPISTAI